MNVVLAGSRRFPKFGIHKYKDWFDAKKLKKVYRILEKAIVDSKFDITTVVSGRCWGIDQLGELWAEINNIPALLFPAEWKKYKKAAGPIRNKVMAQHGDALIAIYTKGSRGTLNMIDNMRKLGKPVFIIEIPKE